MIFSGIKFTKKKIEEERNKKNENIKKYPEAFILNYFFLSYRISSRTHANTHTYKNESEEHTLKCS